LSFKIHGNCNDYLGKGLSGAKLIIKVPPTATFKPEENIIIGNVALMVQLVKHTLTVWLVNVSV
jgi:glutamate synthase (ferredoxin)